MTHDDVLIRVRANLWRDKVAIGGHLMLTDDLLSFRAHGLNPPSEPLDIAVADIVGVATYRSWGMIPNGLVVTTTSGDEYRFVVARRGRLISAIDSLR